MAVYCIYPLSQPACLNPCESCNRTYRTIGAATEQLSVWLKEEKTSLLITIEWPSLLLRFLEEL